MTGLSCSIYQLIPTLPAPSSQKISKVFRKSEHFTPTRSSGVTTDDLTDPLPHSTSPLPFKRHDVLDSIIPHIASSAPTRSTPSLTAALPSTLVLTVKHRIIFFIPPYVDVPPPLFVTPSIYSSANMPVLYGTDGIPADFFAVLQ